MKTFRDNQAREWALTITIDAVKRVRSLLGVNLLDVAGGNLLEQLVSDPVLLCDCVYALVKPEADQRNVSDEEFGRAMAGDAIEQATTALLEELVDFFPQPRRGVLKKALAKLRTVEQTAVAIAEQRLDSPEMDRKLQAILSASSLNWPESSASTPAPSP